MTNSRCMYRVTTVEFVHDKCFVIELTRVRWPTENVAVPPQTVSLEYKRAEEVPCIGSMVWLEVQQ